MRLRAGQGAVPSTGLGRSSHVGKVLVSVVYATSALLADCLLCSVVAAAFVVVFVAVSCVVVQLLCTSVM